ncbi:hypothetical protein BOVATA_024490 [Babesia ovata]|uniref:Uncharacterized protein n=1 Tax=Babesia ovata TaxID=189622 RepID=A0A2H6KD77_9APIC|nr:uncharacterized protein BOVATA_024490 [Babesia ovata]GBE60956.1 hypothetical protein BOVATA_024490 [Babesia ovata]
MALLYDGNISSVALTRWWYVSRKDHRLRAEVNQAHHVSPREVDSLRVPIAATQKVGAASDADYGVPIQRTRTQRAPNGHPACLLKQNTGRRSPDCGESVLICSQVAGCLASAEVAADGAQNVFLRATRKVGGSWPRRLDSRRRRCWCTRGNRNRGFRVGGRLVRSAEVERRLDPHKPILVRQRDAIWVRLQLFDDGVQDVVAHNGANVGIHLGVLKLVVEKFSDNPPNAVSLLRRGVRIASQHLKQVKQRRPVGPARSAG